MQPDIHNGDAEGWGDAAAGESQGNGKDEPRPWNRHVCCPPLQMMPQVVMVVHEQSIAIVEVDWEGHGKKQGVTYQIKQKYTMQYDCVCMCMCVAYMGWERWRMKVRPRPMWSQTRML